MSDALSPHNQSVPSAAGLASESTDSIRQASRPQSTVENRLDDLSEGIQQLGRQFGAVTSLLSDIQDAICKPNPRASSDAEDVY
jgi:hypothetical protein